MELRKHMVSLLPGELSTWERPRREWLLRLGLVILLGALFFPNLGAFGLWDPWETHYGEVSRNMIESYDWVSPWWGYRGKIGDEPRQGTYFFSKPILTFWTEAISIRLIGFSEWAIRLPMAVFALLACFFAYYAVSKIWNRSSGVLACLVMATCPQFFFLARQAQTDMIFVAPMTVGMLFLLLALFGPYEGRISKVNFAAKYLFCLGTFLIASVPQFVVIATDVTDDRTFKDLPMMVRTFAIMKNNGIWHAVAYSFITLIFLVWYLFPLAKLLIKRRALDEEFKDTWVRKGWILIFVTMCGLATLGKGLLGFMLPGAILLVYMLATNQWRLIKALEIPRNLLAFIAVTFPWYVAMFVKHGNAFYARFFVHDHFNRLGTGVHQIDSGTFEHFLKWLGVGMYPWVAFVPLAILLLARLRLSLRTKENQYTLLVFIWFFFSYLLFTLAKTKFHHYIFPALAPMALIIGRALADVPSHRTALVRVAALLGLGLFIGVTLNLKADQQLFRNLFTYKYDRALPEHMPVDGTAPATDEEGAKCSSDSDCGPHEVCQENGLCSTDWNHTQFYAHTTASVRWALNRRVFLYDNFIVYLGCLGAGAFLLFLFRKTRWPAIALLILLGMSQTAWGLSYYLPSLSPHWSQKNVFEDYYDLCGSDLKEVEQEAYMPLLRKIGLDFVADYFQSTFKRVCPYNITSWLIVWRGETYYSYNELIPLEKKNQQLRPYLETINPIMMDLPADCAVPRMMCPRKFYVFMENRKSNTPSSVASSANGETRKIKSDPTSKASSAYADFDKWVARRVSNENDYFTLFEVVPVFKQNASRCSCASATLPNDDAFR